MAITMQGSWKVSVKSKAAAWEQRFRITGADSGNGTYAGSTSTPDVDVSARIPSRLGSTRMSCSIRRPVQPEKSAST